MTMPMKQITIISGKGGTGKTTLTAAFAALAKNTVFADCDVDAADLHLILTPQIIETHPFTGLPLAMKDDEKCTACGVCYEHCRFGAITNDFNIDPLKCEGCGVCVYVCPVNAIRLGERCSGETYLSKTRFGPLVHAKLNIAEEASGKLVTVVRTLAKNYAIKQHHERVLIDGPPGIGCPVIAAITGVDFVVIVTEPTLSGIHDMERVLGVADHFSIPAAVVVNKFDINEEMTEAIAVYCTAHQIPVLGKLPYDNIMTKAMIDGKSLPEYSDGDLTKRIKAIWQRVMEMVP